MSNRECRRRELSSSEGGLSMPGRFGPTDRARQITLSPPVTSAAAQGHSDTAGLTPALAYDGLRYQPKQDGRFFVMALVIVRKLSLQAALFESMGYQRATFVKNIPSAGLPFGWLHFHSLKAECALA